MGDKPKQPEPENPKGNIGQWLWGLIIVVVLVGVLMRTSAPPLVDDRGDEPVIAAPQPSQENEGVPATAPASTQAVDGPLQTRVSVTNPSDPQSGWLKIAEQTQAEEESVAEARYRHENEFDVETRNTNRFQIDLSALPVNRTKRFIMHIDGQDMLFFPKRMGVIRFERSEAGVWKAEKD